MKKRHIASSKLDEQTKAFANHCLEKNDLTRVDQLLYKGSFTNKKRGGKRGARHSSPKPGPSGERKQPAEPGIGGFTLRCGYEDLPKVYAFVQAHPDPKPTIVVEPTKEAAPAKNVSSNATKPVNGASGTKGRKVATKPKSGPEVPATPVEPYSPPVEAIDRFDYEVRKRQKAFVTQEEYAFLEKRRKEQECIPRTSRRIAHVPKLQVAIRRQDSTESSGSASSEVTGARAAEAETTIAAASPQAANVSWNTLNETTASEPSANETTVSELSTAETTSVKKTVKISIVTVCFIVK